ncbi:thiol-disulfide oxidoreductase DCC family protein [Agaribacterium sp. ZY112]|uniref:thiol-disulfide oxidoreductase DCC family protein n=1 Tax=Agaribacterium sp. ZY112 TaxID=3233574 RepID=UPI0035261D3A
MNKAVEQPVLRIFYDGLCPICSLEMNKLKQCDQQKRIHVVDLHTPDFEQLYPHIDLTEALSILHGEYKGSVILGLDVTHRAWTLVGKAFYVAPLQWPVFKPFAGFIYRRFARYRKPISNFLYRRLGVGHDASLACQRGRCYEK